MATFSDFYRNQSGAKQASPGSVKTDFSAFKQTTDKANAAQSPINWAIDILSRPLYGVTNMISHAADAGVSGGKKAAQGDVLGAIMDAIGAGAGGGAFLEGLTSNDPTVKRSTGQVIEQTTDKVGTTIDPNYVDRPNNVNPVVKGVAGFAGDVALDPLTWIPGGVLLKAGKGALEVGKAGAELVAKGAKAGAQAVKDAKAGDKIAADLIPAEKAAVKAEEVTPPPTETNPFLSDAAAPKGATVPELPVSKAPEVAIPKTAEAVLPEVRPTATPEVAPVVEPTLRELFNASVKAPAMRQELTDIVSTIGKGVNKEVPVPKPIDWLKENATTPLAQGTKIPFIQTLKNPPKTYGDIARIVQGDRVANAGKLSDRGRAFNTVLQEAYQGHIAGLQAAKGSAVLDHLQAYRDRVATDRARVETALGPELLSVLGRKNTPASMERAFANINKALDPETDLHKFFQSNRQLAPAIQAGLDIPKHVQPKPNDAADLVRAEIPLTQEGTVKEVFAKVLGQETPTSKAFRQRYPEGRKSTAFTDKDKQIRLGNNWRELNTFFQYTFYRNLVGELKTRMATITGKDGPLYGRANAAAWRDAIDSLGDDITNSIQTFGTKLHIGVGGDLLPITFPEVYRSVFNAFDDSDKALLALYNGGSNVAFTVLMQAVHHASMAGDLTSLGKGGVLELRKELIDMLEDPKKYGTRGGFQGGEIPNNINKPGAQAFVYAPNQKKAAQAFANKVSGKVVKTEGEAWQVILPKGALVEDLADSILKAQPNIVQRIADNAQTWKERGLAEASTLSNAQIGHIRQLLASGAYRSEIFKAVDDIPKTVADDATKVGATQDAVNMGTEVATASVGDELTQQAAVGVKLETELKATEDTTLPVEEAAQKTVDNTVEHVQKSAEEAFDEVTTPGEAGAVKIAQQAEDNTPTFDISDMTTGDMQQQVQAGLLHNLREAFDTGYGYKRLEAPWNSVRSVSRRYLENKHEQLRKLAQTYDRDTLAASFAAIQAGERPAHLEQSIVDVQNVMHDIFNTDGGSSILDNLFLSTERELSHINAIFAMKRVEGLEFDRGAAKMAAKELYKTKRPTAQQIAGELDKQWRTVPVKDPIDWLARLSDAAATVSEHRSMAGYFMNFFGEKGLVSKTPKDGMVKLVAGGPSTFRSMLPKNVYADPLIAQELRKLDILTRTSREIEGKVGQALREYYFPLQNTWKKYMTIFRVGHHIRNFVGDSSLTFVARGPRHFSSSYQDAMSVLGFKNSYSNLDLIDSMKRLEGADFKLPQGGNVLVRGAIHGKPVELTTEALHAALADHGLLTTFGTAEDLLNDAVLRSPVQQAMKKISLDDTRIQKLAGGTSEFVAHIGRAQHFIQILKQELGKGDHHFRFSNIDELMTQAAKEVRSAHPDGSMLTTFEHKYMRVAIPFYSWFGKVLPFAIESLLRNPGRVMTFPKASYNVAVAMGINPDSLSDPFPEDQLFPSFLTGGAFGPQFKGPDGQYVNINPGFAHTDLATTLEDPIHGIMGMTSPLLRMPFELATGSTVQGTKINSVPDYLDSNLPVVNYLANVTGISPTGTVGGILTGQGVQQQAQVQKGNKDSFDQLLSSLNWLTGMNAQNWSRPNFINYAEIEKRNAAAKQSGSK